MPQKCWEDFQVGQRFTTQSVTVTEAHVANFACLTGDWNPLHVDEEYAKRTQFGTRIAHGPLIFCLTIGLIHLAGVVQDSVMAFLGVDNWRATAPTKLGDTIHAQAEVSHMRETKKPDRGITTLHLTAKNQREEAVTEFDLTVMMHRRQG